MTRRLVVTLGALVTLFAVPCIAGSSGCDVNGDGVVDARDILQMISEGRFDSETSAFALTQEWCVEAPVDTPTPTATDTPQDTATQSPTETPTEIPSPTHTDSPTPTATVTPTATQTPTATDTPLSGAWVGTYEETQSSESVLVDGYLVLDLKQTGESLSVTVRPENYVLTGTRHGASVSVSGKDKDNNTVTIEGTLSGTGSTGTFSVVGNGVNHRGTLSIAPAGQRVDCAGIWTGAFVDAYDSGGHKISGSKLMQISQSTNRLTVKMLVDDEQLTGYLEGDIFVLMLNDLKVSGRIDRDTFSAIYQEEEANNFYWGTLDAEKTDGGSVNGAGSWTIRYREKYPYQQSTLTYPVTAVQSGNTYTLKVPNERGGTTSISGEIYGDTFIVDGTLDGDDIRIDGIVTGSSMVGTVESDDGHGWWGWGTYTGSK